MTLEVNGAAEVLTWTLTAYFILRIFTTVLGTILEINAHVRNAAAVNAAVTSIKGGLAQVHMANAPTTGTINKIGFN